MAKRTAVIDIGSNSVRLVIYEKTSRFAFHLLNESKSRVRLSENVYKNGGNLQDVPMQRTIDALRDFLSVIESYKVRKTLCVATSALRDAPNKHIFIKRVRDELNLKIKVIEGEKEAYFGGIACANLLPKVYNAISVDIGGGSTEISSISDKDVTNTVSLNLGTVRLKELFFDKDKVKDAKKFIDDKLAHLDNLDADTIMGIGGTIRAISKAVMDKQNYPLNKIHAFTYTAKELEKFISDILDAKNEKELASLGIKKERFDIIKPGALILQRILKKLPIKNIITSGVGVREGVFLSDLLRNSNDRFPLNYNTSVRYIIDAYISEKQYANDLNRLCKNIFDLVYKDLNIDYKYKKELAIAAKLYPSGSSIHYFSKNKHSYYLIQSALEYGFTHKQIILIATLCRYAKRKLPSDLHIKQYEILLPQKKVLYMLSYILSLAVSLLVHRPRKIDFDISFNDGKLFVDKKGNTMRLSVEAVKKLEPVDGFEVII